MPTEIDTVWRSVDPVKRDRLLAALATQGFVPASDATQKITLDRPCIAIWARDDLQDAFGQLDSLNEAARTRRLVSVLLEKTPLPASLAPHPVIDLVNWRGSTDNASFETLVTALSVAAKDCGPATIGGHASRRVQRLIGKVTVVAVIGFLFWAVMNVLAVQNNLCSIRFVQPHLSDMCGYFGLGGKPDREERLAWEARPAGSCEALRVHIDRFQTGALRDVAADILNARRLVQDETWVADEQLLRLYVLIGEVFPDLPSAQADARERTLAEAEQLCSGFAATDAYRLLSSGVSVETWSCDATTAGHVCGFDGMARCSLERAVRTIRETCEVVP